MQYQATPLIEHSWVGSPLHTISVIVKRNHSESLSFRAIRCGVPVRWYIASPDENLVNYSPSD
jgi:hypothetical protein